MDNFVDVIAEYDKAQKRRWRFIVFTIIVFSVAGIYLLGVIVERYSTPRFLTIQQQIEVTIDITEGTAEMLQSPSEESLVASPTMETIELSPTLNPIFAQATERAWSVQGAVGGGR